MGMEIFPGEGADLSSPLGGGARFFDLGGVQGGGPKIQFSSCKWDKKLKKSPPHAYIMLDLGQANGAFKSSTSVL